MVEPMPLFEEPVPTPRFEELVLELDRLIDDQFLAEVDAALEDLFLARVGADRAA
jgi:hypothetical protein